MRRSSRGEKNSQAATIIVQLRNGFLKYGCANGLVPPSWILHIMAQEAAARNKGTAPGGKEFTGPRPGLPLSRRERKAWLALEKRLR